MRQGGIATSFYLPACAVLGVLAFLFNWHTGHKGLMFLDQSTIFDGAWRVFQGQIPYKDFFSPVGPLAFYILAFFFWIAGVNWSAAVLGACVLNSIATLSVIRVVRLLGGGSRILALCAGLATALSFQPVFGTLYYEQTAMFLDLLALHAAVESLQAAAPRRGYWQILSGVFLGLALITKQNFSVFFAPVLVAVLAAGELPSVRQTIFAILRAGLATLAVAVLFLGWVFLFSDFAACERHALITAREIGKARLTPRVLAQAFSFNISPNLLQVDLAGMFFGLLALVSVRFPSPLWRQLAPAAAAAVTLPLFRSLVQASTDNDAANTFGLSGLSVCVGLAVWLKIVPHLGEAFSGDLIRMPSAKTMGRLGCLAVGIWSVAAFGYVGRAAWTRSVHEYQSGTVFRETIRVPGLERVYWGEPTWHTYKNTLKGTINKGDFENVAAYLVRKKTNFFVMGDALLLYGLLGAKPPQPLLYFQHSHSFLERHIPVLDPLITAELERNGVGVVVREKFMFTDTDEGSNVYSFFPLLQAWFKANFTLAEEHGNYEIWERNAGAGRR